MRRFSLVAVSLIISAVFAISASAQTGAAQPGPAKIGLINSGAFGVEKEGITRYVNALKQLDTEFKPSQNELVTMSNKLQALADQIAAIQKMPPNLQNQKDIADKQDEGQRLQRELDFKKKDYDARVDKRSGELLGPIQEDIGKAIQEYSMTKGYTIVFDIAKIGADGSLLAMDPKAEFTKEFIAYFNTRPAGTTATPK